MERTTKKIIQALAYIAYQQANHKINSMKAYKLLWLADRYHLRQFGRTITGDTFFALPHGVVPSDAKNVVEHQNTHIPNDEEYAAKYIKRISKYSFHKDIRNQQIARIVPNVFESCRVKTVVSMKD